MKRFWFTLFAVALCATMLVGCNKTPDTTDNSVTIPTATPLTPAGELGAPFVGTWDVQATKSSMVKLELMETGAAIMTASGGQTLSGRFEVLSETELSLTFSSSLSGTYVINGDTITISSDTGDTLVLTKAE